MNKSIFNLVLVAVSFVLATGNLFAEPVCHKCEVIREENKKKVNHYEYYEDYLKDHPQDGSKQAFQKNTSTENEEDDSE